MLAYTGDQMKFQRTIKMILNSKIYKAKFTFTHAL